jgi:hypothetical protein
MQLNPGVQPRGKSAAREVTHLSVRYFIPTFFASLRVLASLRDA